MIYCIKIKVKMQETNICAMNTTLQRLSADLMTSTDDDSERLQQGWLGLKRLSADLMVSTINGYSDMVGNPSVSNAFRLIRGYLLKAVVEPCARRFSQSQTPFG